MSFIIGPRIFAPRRLLDATDARNSRKLRNYSHVY